MHNWRLEHGRDRCGLPNAALHVSTTLPTLPIAAISIFAALGLWLFDRPFDALSLRAAVGAAFKALIARFTTIDACFDPSDLLGFFLRKGRCKSRRRQECGKCESISHRCLSPAGRARTIVAASHRIVLHQSR